MPDLETRPYDVDGADDLAAHRALLKADVLDTSTDLRARPTDGCVRRALCGSD